MKISELTSKLEIEMMENTELRLKVDSLKQEVEVRNSEIEKLRSTIDKLVSGDSLGDEGSILFASMGNDGSLVKDDDNDEELELPNRPRDAEPEYASVEDIGGPSHSDEDETSQLVDEPDEPDSIEKAVQEELEINPDPPSKLETENPKDDEQKFKINF